MCKELYFVNMWTFMFLPISWVPDKLLKYSNTRNIPWWYSQFVLFSFICSKKLLSETYEIFFLIFYITKLVNLYLLEIKTNIFLTYSVEIFHLYRYFLDKQKFPSFFYIFYVIKLENLVQKSKKKWIRKSHFSYENLNSND